RQHRRSLPDHRFDRQPPPRPPQSTIHQLTSLLINNAGALGAAGTWGNGGNGGNGGVGGASNVHSGDGGRGGAPAAPAYQGSRPHLGVATTWPVAAGTVVILVLWGSFRVRKANTAALPMASMAAAVPVASASPYVETDRLSGRTAAPA
ncbi:hypothetical protein OSI97_22640, partial [Mycobacterium ulcerans]